MVTLIRTAHRRAENFMPSDLWFMAGWPAHSNDNEKGV